MEEIGFIMDVAKEAMEKSLDHLDKAFINIRAGKANPADRSHLIRSKRPASPCGP